MYSAILLSMFISFIWFDHSLRVLLSQTHYWIFKNGVYYFLYINQMHSNYYWFLIASVICISYIISSKNFVKRFFYLFFLTYFLMFAVHWARLLLYAKENSKSSTCFHVFFMFLMFFIKLWNSNGFSTLQKFIIIN